MTARALAGLVLAALLAACGGGNVGLHGGSTTAGPDEFAVTPTLPLALPETLDLPPPTPGGPNRADIRPEAQIAVALGGTPGAGVPGDPALISFVSRNGVDPAIRQTLAEEDARFRRARGRLTVFNPFARSRYFQVYAGQALDAQAELERFRAAGIPTPSAPPAN